MSRSDDVMAAILQQQGQALPEQGRVLGNHDAHGSTASTRVPPSTRLTTDSSPPMARTRSCNPANPDPLRTTAPPLPSSRTRTTMPPGDGFTLRAMVSAAAYLMALVTASLATK